MNTHLIDADNSCLILPEDQERVLEASIRKVVESAARPGS